MPFERALGTALACAALLRANLASADDEVKAVDDDEETLTATATVEAPPRAPVTRTIEREEMASVAGTRGDALRAVELLPGVSRPAVGNDQPIIRGANPFDTQVFLEGAPVPVLYHLAGLSSFVHSRVLDSIDLQPSNFSPRYGRKVGGIIEVKLRDPKRDGLHGIAEASLLDTSLLVETPLGSHVSVLAAARRSNIDAVLRQASKLGELGITTAPVYWDYQGVAAFELGDRDRIRLLAYGSSDYFGLVLAHPSESDPALRGSFEDTTVFHRVQAEYRHRTEGGGSLDASLTYGRVTETGHMGADLGRFNLDIDLLQGRTEWASNVTKAVRVVAGLDVLANRFDADYSGIPPPTGENDPNTALSLLRRLSVKVNEWETLPGAYLEMGIRPWAPLLLSPGVRADYDYLIGEGAVDPRLSARLDVTEQTTVKAGLGRFSQAPDARMAIASVGNPDLRMTHALHASTGVEQRIGDRLTASAEGFVKRIDGIVTPTPEGGAPYYTNQTDGRILGGELLLRLKPAPDSRFFGFLSYTLMRSERRDVNGGAWRLFDRDQPHIVSATGLVRLGRGWELGASVRYTSGTPYTPIVGATYDATSDVYSPRSGRVLSQRNPPFFRVDLRAQKTWTFSRWSLAAYLDLQNATNQRNAEGFSYSYDYRRRQSGGGLPILPIVGLRGEL